MDEVKHRDARHKAQVAERDRYRPVFVEVAPGSLVRLGGVGCMGCIPRLPVACGKCLKRVENEGANWQPVLAVRAAALMGGRLREVEGLLKSDVDPVRMVLRFQSTKTGKNVRPIG